MYFLPPHGEIGLGSRIPLRLFPMSSFPIGQSSQTPTDGDASAFAVASSASDVSTAKETPKLSSSDTTRRSSDTEIRVAVSKESCQHFKLDNLISLLEALNAQSPEVVAHCLRVASICSQWGEHRGLNSAERELLEILATFHDLSFLTGDESLAEKGSLQCIDACAGSAELQKSFSLYHRWVASDASVRASIETTELISMLAIADVFDSLTCGDVFGTSLTPAQAITELHRAAGTTFDLGLLREFSLFTITNSLEGSNEKISSWLKKVITVISSSTSNQRLYPSLGTSSRHMSDEEIFHRRLFDYMHQGVVFVDRELRIFEWNRAAERLTGLMQVKTLDEVWRPGLIGLMDEESKAIVPEKCPLADTIIKGIQSLRRLKLKNRDGREIVIDAHFLPIRNGVDELCGATFMFADASQQAHLEKRVQTLHEKATRDGLTLVANRAELDRQLGDFVNTCAATGERGCLIITDIDRFKKINDIYGHQAGDLALKTFADVLRENAGKIDIVARYGGEEFAILCRNSTLEEAVKKAEKMRAALQVRPLPCLKGTSLTASFGVTELGPADTSESVIQRADEALIRAKESGRNRVLFNATTAKAEPAKVAAPIKKENTNWFGWFGTTQSELLFDQEWLTAVPLNVVVEKVRGAVGDFRAEILLVDESKVQFRVDTQLVTELRRKTDRNQRFIINLHLTEVDFSVGKSSNNQSKRTMLRIEIMQLGRRDRRVNDHREQAEILARMLQSYLVAQVVDNNIRQHISTDR